jgi:hypothetical protein
MRASAVGQIGTVAEYLLNTVTEVERAGVHAPCLWWLQAMVADRLAQLPQPAAMQPDALVSVIMPPCPRGTPVSRRNLLPGMLGNRAPGTGNILVCAPRRRRVARPAVRRRRTDAKRWQAIPTGHLSRSHRRQCATANAAPGIKGRSWIVLNAPTAGKRPSMA